MFRHRGFSDHRLTQIDTDYEPKALIRMILDFLGTDGHGF